MAIQVSECRELLELMMAICWMSALIRTGALREGTERCLFENCWGLHTGTVPHRERG